MPLIYDPNTGRIIEGAIPAVNTKVLALVAGRKQEVYVNIGGGGDPGEVTDDAFRVDNRNAGRRATDSSAVAIPSAEVNRRSVDAVTAAVLGQANEVAKRAAEDVSNVVTAISTESARRAAVEVPMIAAAVAEVARRASESAAAQVSTGEAAKRADETTPLSATAVVAETGRRQSDQIEVAVIAATDSGRRSAETNTVVVTLAGYASAVASNTGFTNPNNALGNTTGTAATLVATASGLAGTTNNTAGGTLVLDFQDVNLGDLTLGTVTVNVERQGATAGVAIVQPTSSVQFQYSFDNTNWTNIFSLTTPATAKGISTLDLTAVVGQDQSKLSALRIRANGSITSGTGLGASNTVSFFRAWMTLTATRAY